MNLYFILLILKNEYFYIYYRNMISVKFNFLMSNKNIHKFWENKKGGINETL